MFLPAAMLLATVLLTVVSCQVTKQAKTAVNLASCDFRILSADKVMLAGLPLDTYGSLKDLGIADLAMIMGAVTRPSLPLSLQLNVEVKNPNAQAAGINSLAYIIYIDDIQMIEGVYDKPVTVPANSTVVIPVPLNTDLKQVLQGKSIDALLNFGFNLGGVGHQPTRFRIRLKPGIMVGNTTLSYPGYINVKTEYSNGTVTY